MTGRALLNLLSPQGGVLPTAEHAARAYGQKTAGLMRLMLVGPGSPVPFHFPPFMAAVSPASYARATDAELGRTFHEMMAAVPAYAPWFARSSSLEEQPGKYDSPVFGLDPQHDSRSRRRLIRNVREMQETRDHMGVLLMPMLGGLTTFADGTQGYAYDLVSFAMDTVNPAKPDEMYIAVVQGLGKGAVESDEAMLMGVNRESGEITFVGNRNEENLLTPSATLWIVKDRHQYRQKRAHYFDGKKGGLKSRLLEPSFFSLKRAMSHYAIEGGELVLYMGHHRADTVGLTPFDSTEMVSNLIGIGQYLHAELGPSQVEGTFVDSRSPHPYLLQHISPPSLPIENRKLLVSNPQFVSNEVFGTGSFEGPLIVYRVPQWAGDADELPHDPILQERCEREGSSYMLMTSTHTPSILENSRECPVRITPRTANVAMHAITEMRYRADRERDKTIVMAMETASTEQTVPKPDEILRGHHGTILVFNHATIDSNGSEMALRIHSSE